MCNRNDQKTSKLSELLKRISYPVKANFRKSGTEPDTAYGMYDDTFSVIDCTRFPGKN